MRLDNEKEVHMRFLQNEDSPNIGEFALLLNKIRFLYMLVSVLDSCGNESIRKAKEMCSNAINGGTGRKNGYGDIGVKMAEEIRQYVEKERIETTINGFSNAIRNNKWEVRELRLISVKRESPIDIALIEFVDYLIIIPFIIQIPFRVSRRGVDIHTSMKEFKRKANDFIRRIKR